MKMNYKILKQNSVDQVKDNAIKLGYINGSPSFIQKFLV